jgi:hypothetical protein
MKNKTVYIVCLLVLASFIALFFLLGNKTKTAKHIAKQALSKEKQTSNGALLFNQYCGSCHLHPNPKHLTKTVWQSEVLPIMAIKMGLVNDKYDRKITEEEKDIEQANHLIPEKPMLTKEDFEVITSYITDQAPDTASH